MRARCADGPYIGQTFEFPRPEWNPAPSSSFYSLDIGPLMWIINGADRHCYQLVSNGWYRGWRLVYRDTF